MLAPLRAAADGGAWTGSAAAGTAGAAVAAPGEEVEAASGFEAMAFERASGEEEKRRLLGGEPANITASLPQTAAQLYIAETGVTSLPVHPLGQAGLQLDAGINYTTVEIQAAQYRFVPGDYPMGCDGARLKIVDSQLTPLEASGSACLTRAQGLQVVSAPYGALLGVTTTIRYGKIAPDNIAEGGTLQADALLNFNMGGLFRFCYSQAGTFEAGMSSLAPVMMTVSGVYDQTCALDDATCLSKHRYECYLRRQDYNTPDGIYSLDKTSCKVDFSAVGTGYIGTKGKGTWSAAFSVQYDSGGKVMPGSFIKPLCGQSAPADFICRRGGACDSGNAYVPAEGVSLTSTGGTARIPIPVTSNQLVGSTGAEAFGPRTVAACYCPGRNGCAAVKDYSQQVGILHYYASKICRAGAFKTNGQPDCPDDYTGVVAQYRFRVRVECPTDACGTNTDSKIKLVENNVLNDEPSWSSSSHCSIAEHGYIYGKQVLPQTFYDLIDGTFSGYVNPIVMGGGVRQDYKDFGGKLGMNFTMGFTTHEARTFHTTHNIDVCYCNGNCDASLQNWFKVGAFRLTPTQLASSATEKSDLPAQWSLEFVNQPGIIALHRLYADAAVFGLQERSILKIVKDQERTIRDVECALSGYNSQLTDGLANDVAASMNYLGMRQTQTPKDLKKIVFNSDALVNSITVKESGTIAVCYCAYTVDDVCQDVENWVLLTQITIKGPKIGQQWLFSTNVVFRFSYEGYGLSSQDNLRIISSDGNCLANNNDPDTASFAYTGLNVACPVPCLSVGRASSSVPGDLSTLVLAADHYGCNEQNTNCDEGGNDIMNVKVLSETWTELVFDKPHGISGGDEITLGSNIICDPSDTVCTPESLAALKGVFDFADLDTQNGLAPNSYIAAKQVQHTDDPRVLHIKVGWPAPAPKFVVQMVGSNPALGIQGRGGVWTHHSRALTREEIMGTTEKANLRVCWRFGNSAAPKYVIEIGRLTVRDPAPMLGATVSMSSTLMNNLAPMILTFSTAGGITGMKYDDAVDSLRLKIVFTRINDLDIEYTGLAGGVIPFEVPGEDEYGYAKQSICGKLFSELWSSDMANGFPFPKGCYYKALGGASPRREIYLVFEAMSGLKKDSQYMLVFNGKVKTLLPQDLVPGDAVAEVYPMDDVTNRPYEAIERGIATLASRPEGIGTDSNGVPDPANPKFRQKDGFKILGGFNDLLELRGGDSITFDIMGDKTTGRILAGMHIRVFLWPFTQWKTTSSCLAECVTDSEVNFVCATITQCRALPVVEGSSLNILKVTLPKILGQNTWGEKNEGLYGQSKVRLRIGGFTMPSSGFFAQKLAAQVTNTNDASPFYVHTDGDYIWKQPDVGQQSAKLVAAIGGGDTAPFRGEQGNILYARITLASTLLARDASGLDAYFEITLPAGYTCLNKNPLTSIVGKGLNAWEAASDLGVFRGELPQGRGAPTDGTPMHGWSVEANVCRFTPEGPFGVVYAGSSFFVKVAVNNPTEALQRADAGNVWFLTLVSRGVHHYDEAYKGRTTQVTKAYPFIASGDLYYQSAAAVLGLVSDAVCQPSSFTPSNPRPVLQSLQFFFRTQQEVSAGGFVQIMIPDGLSFVDPCQADHLPDSYYATSANPEAATLRIPGTMNCTIQISMKRKAEIRFTRIMVAFRMYAFQIDVQNPFGYQTQHQDGWYLYTGDAEGNLVDGTPETIPFLGGGTDSWAVYSGPNTKPSNFSDFQSNYEVDVAFQIMDTRPKLLITSLDKRTFAKILLRNTGTPNSGAIRFVAPPGYVWNFLDAEFVFESPANAPQSHFNVIPAGVNSDWPAGIPFPRDGSATLKWSTAAFDISKTYSFSAPIFVPAIQPATASNAFYLEFGYDGTSQSQRVLGAYMPGPQIRALRNARVDYATNIIKMENLVEITIETVTHIPQGGMIEITVPAGFLVPTPCKPLPVRNPGALGVVPNVSCAVAKDGLGRPLVRLTSPPGGVEPGIYSFGILTENPEATQDLFQAASASGPPPSASGFPAAHCLMSVCWYIGSYMPSTVPPGAPIDYAISTSGFGIQKRMLEARIPLMTEEQRIGTARDDRPLMPNNLILALKLQAKQMSASKLRIYAPYGFEFPETCLSSLATDETLVFGLGNSFPAYFAKWPLGVVVTDCEGDGIKATLTLAYKIQGAGFAASQLYIFRIGLMANPIMTPTPNLWTIELGGESSEPMQGMTLWAFTHESITATTTARDQTLAGQTRTVNPLKIRLRPFNDVPSGGRLQAVAEQGFQFKALPSQECTAELQELPYTSFGVRYPGYKWPSAGLVCLVAAEDPRRLSVRLKDPRPMSQGLDYELILSVYNPNVQLDGSASDPTNWIISSFGPTGLSLDESRITAFRINDVMSQWWYRNPDPANPGQVLRNGNTLLPGFQLEMEFPSELKAGDRVEIQVPQDFDLLDTVGNCNGFYWVDPLAEDEAGANTFNPLPNTPPICTSRTMVFNINEPTAVPRFTPFQFGLSIYNPLRTPPLSENFWTAAHLNQNGVIQSSKAFQSWDIIAQLEAIVVELMGPNMAAGSISLIRVEFTAVTSAADIAIKAVSPIGFNFKSAYLSSPTCPGNKPCQVLLVDPPIGNEVRILMEIVEGTRYVININNVQLGEPGGPTTFDIATWVGGRFQGGLWIPGQARDVRLGYTGGFRLPGKIGVRYDKLSNVYMEDSLMYPVPSLWESQMGRPCTVEFDFDLTVEASPGHYLVIYSNPYEPTFAYFRLQERQEGGFTGSAAAQAEAAAALVVDASVESIIDGEIHIKFHESLTPEKVYMVVFSAVAPHPEEVLARGIPLRWTLQTRDGGLKPTNTNDGVGHEFPLVAEYKFEVEVSRAPPTSTVDILLRVDVGLSVPTEIRVVAPLGFNFSLPCLVSGGTGISGCVLGKPTSFGHARVHILLDTGMTGVFPEIVIRASTPAASPLLKNWFVEGVDKLSDVQRGWGEAQGFDVQQMADTVGVYGGVPTVRTPMIWSFRSQVVIQAGGWLEVVLPDGMDPECYPAAFISIALPDQVACDASDETHLKIHINSTIVPGEYAFGFYLTPPLINPVKNEISLILKNRNGQVKDAAVRMPAPPIQDKLRIQALPLQWTSSRAGRATTISIGFNALETLPDPIIAEFQQVGEILITLPSGFLHLVEIESDFSSTNEDLPKRRKGWLDYMKKNQVRVSLDLNQTGSWAPMKSGKYEFRFPVLVPMLLPAVNVWHISLCSPSYPNGCTRLSDPNVLLSFPMAGFNFGDAGDTTAMTGAALSLTFRPLFVCILAWLTFVAGSR